jgi:hypothetical protein
VPRDVLVICLGKSTYARCGLIVNVTPFEPEWEGTATLEISNTTPLPAKIYANEGIAHYNEELMLTAGLFADAPHSQTTVHNFMRLRALRVVVDVNLATGVMLFSVLVPTRLWFAPNQPITVNPKTEGAIKVFQRRHGLRDDGVVGPKTRAARASQAPSPPSSPSASCTATGSARARGRSSPSATKPRTASTRRLRSGAQRPTASTSSAETRSAPIRRPSMPCAWC